MAFLGETFSTDSLPVSERSFDLIPDGWYNATITKAELNDTKAGTGKKIDMRYDITGPTHQGRVVFGCINIRNQSKKAESIGLQQLGEHMRAVGLVNLDNSDEFIGGNLCIKIKIKQPTDQDIANGYGNPRNEIDGVRSVSGAMPKVNAPAAPAAPAPTSQPGGSKPPWAA